LEASDTISINASDVESSLPSDHHKTLYLRITAPTDKRSDITDKFKPYADLIATYIDPSANQVSMPYIWSTYAKKIKWSCPSDGSYTATIDYMRKAPTLADDTDVPVIPEEYQELLELGAYMRIAKREDDYDVKSAEQADYTAQLVSLLHTYGRELPPRGRRIMRVSGRTI